MVSSSPHPSGSVSSSDPVTSDLLRWFDSDPGRRCLAAAARQADDSELRAQQVLRRQYTASQCRAALAIVSLRRHAREKFPDLAGSMFFDREGLEMASRLEVSQYRARRFAGRGSIADLGCGIGGDLLGLARHASVWGIDLHPARLRAARMNAAAAGLGDRVGFVEADISHLPVRADALFADPSRRRDADRVRAVEAYSPSLPSLLALRSRVSDLAVKVAPGIREEDIPAECEVEFISSGGQCREAVLWFGGLATGSRRATVLPGPHSLQGDESGREDIPVGPPGRFVGDPDPAVVRSHLLHLLADELSAWRLDRQVAYLSMDSPVASPLVRLYEVLDRVPFHLRRLRQRLVAEGWYPDQIMRRRFPLPPDQLRRLLKLPGDKAGPEARPVSLITTRISGDATVLICQRVES